jgi:hypothetical protein
MRRVSSVVCVAAVALCVVSSGALAAPPLPQTPAVQHGNSVGANGPYTPPPCVAGVPFADVTCSTFYDAWIEQFARDGITSGCGNGDYCPNENVTRAQMAVFVEAAMHGTGNWPPHTVLVYHHPMGEADSNLNSGTELMNLVGGIPSSGPEAPGNGNPWLIKLGPGIWDLGSSTLSLPGWVSIEGSGMEETVITSSTSGAATTMYILPGVTTLTRLTVQNVGATGSEGFAIQANSGRLVLDRAEAYAEGSAGDQIGIYANDAAIELYNEAGASAIGGSSYAIYTGGSQNHALTIHHAIVDAYSYAIANSAGYEVDMAYSGVYDSGLYNTGAGLYKCIGNYDRDMALVTCP